MFAINLITIFIFGLVITGIVFKGILQAQEFSKLENENNPGEGSDNKSGAVNKKKSSSGEIPLDTY